MPFDYFYGRDDAEQYQFYRIPKPLITGEQFREISCESKLLYGLMLDRLSLSMKNGWFDDLNRAYKSKGNAEKQLQAVKSKGFDAFITEAGGLYKIQVGAYSQKSNADAQLAKVKAAGFDAFITTNSGSVVSSAPSIRVGSNVRVRSGAKTYNGVSLASFVYSRVHQVSQINGDRAVISYNGTVVAAVHTEDLILVS